MKKIRSPTFKKKKITHLDISGEPTAKVSQPEGMMIRLFPKTMWENFKISILYSFHKDSEHPVEDL